MEKELKIKMLYCQGTRSRSVEMSYFIGSVG